MEPRRALVNVCVRVRLIRSKPKSAIDYVIITFIESALGRFWLKWIIDGTSTFVTPFPFKLHKSPENITWSDCAQCGIPLQLAARASCTDCWYQCSICSAIFQLDKKRHLHMWCVNWCAGRMCLACMALSSPPSPFYPAGRCKPKQFHIRISE